MMMTMWMPKLHYLMNGMQTTVHVLSEKLENNTISHNAVILVIKNLTVIIHVNYFITCLKMIVITTSFIHKYNCKI